MFNALLQERDTFILPDSTYDYSITSEENFQRTLVVSTDEIQETKGGKIIIGVYSAVSNTESISLDLKLQYQDPSK